MIAYVLTNMINGKCYVGITTKAESRLKDHQSSATRGSGYALHDAMRLYGIANFEFKVVASCRTWGDLQEIEKILIVQYESFAGDGTGYNLTRGGDGMLGYKHSDEYKARASASKMGMKHSEDACAKISAALSRRICKPETRVKFSKIHTGRVKSPEERAKMSATRKGMSSPRKGAVLSQETRDKISKAQKGMRKGIPLTEEHIAKISAGRIGLKTGPQKVEHIEKRLVKLRGQKRGPEALNNLRLGALKKPTRAASGFRGVTKHGKKWQASYAHHGKKICVGTFSTPEEAYEAYLRATAFRTEIAA